MRLLKFISLLILIDTNAFRQWLIQRQLRLMTKKTGTMKAKPIWFEFDWISHFLLKFLQATSSNEDKQSVQVQQRKRSVDAIFGAVQGGSSKRDKPEDDIIFVEEDENEQEKMQVWSLIRNQNWNTFSHCRLTLELKPKRPCAERCHHSECADFWAWTWTPKGIAMNDIPI